jgi:EmrB/QacA subfamily drug resistance transporter
MPADARRWWTLAAMSGVLAMYVTDATVVSVALPSIQRDLNLSPGTVQWVVTAFSLTLAATLATGGRLGDLFGRRRAVVGGVVLFALGSTLAALSPDPAVLFTGRVVEGLGAVLMMPAASVLVNEAFEPQERGRAAGTYMALGSTALVLGPPLSGALVQSVGWRAVFLVNVPIACVVLVLIAIARPTDHRLPTRPFRAGHSLLLIAGLTAFVLGLQQSHVWHWTSPATWGLLGGGIALLTAFVMIQLRRAEPLLNLRLFCDPGFTADAIALYCAQFGLIGQTAFLAIYLQQILHFAPLDVGLAMLLFVVPAMLMAPVAGLLYDRRGVKPPTVLGLALMTLGLFLQTQAYPLREFAWIAPCLLLIGLGMGLALSQTYTDGMARVPAAERGQAYGLLDTIKQLGGAMGMAAIGSLVAAQEGSRLGRIVEQHADSAAQRASLHELLLQALRGEVSAAHALAERWPAVLAELNESGAQSIAAGFYLGSAVSAVGLVLVRLLMPGGRRTVVESERPTGA